ADCQRPEIRKPQLRPGGANVSVDRKTFNIDIIDGGVLVSDRTVEILSRNRINVDTSGCRSRANAHWSRTSSDITGDNDVADKSSVCGRCGCDISEQVSVETSRRVSKYLYQGYGPRASLNVAARADLSRVNTHGRCISIGGILPLGNRSIKKTVHPKVRYAACNNTASQVAFDPCVAYHIQADSVQPGPIISASQVRRNERRRRSSGASDH